jgi:hypothetical protein
MMAESVKMAGPQYSETACLERPPPMRRQCLNTPLVYYI